MSESNNEPKHYSEGRQTLEVVLKYVRDLFDLHGGTEEELTTTYIKRNIEFKGESLWMLVFAILICSIGLNINSTAVIIGAMLISPLMGPIIGAGLGVGTNDWEIFKNSLANLAVATVVSILTSALYFFITPLQEPQSELIARTFPTIFDVLIAAFGGATGIVAVSRKEKGNAIPGVAIATALMPPLCTTGYGIATGNLAFFVGALYLFIINSVMISISTVIFVKYWHFEKKEFLDEAREKRVKRYIFIVILLTILPSLFTVYALINNSIFENNAKRFIEEAFNSEYRQGTYKITAQLFSDDPKTIEIFNWGTPLNDSEKVALEEKLESYGLKNAKLKIHDGSSGLSSDDMASLRSSLIKGALEDIIDRNEETIRNKDSLIFALQNQLKNQKNKFKPLDQIAAELKVLYPTIIDLWYNEMPSVNFQTMQQDTIPTLILDWRAMPSRTTQRKVEELLRLRLEVDTLKVVNL